MPTFLAGAAGGALGVTSRYGLDRLIERRSFAVFPCEHVHDQRLGLLPDRRRDRRAGDRHEAPG